jgi:endonuclease V-like protein UPF0215 family
VTAPRRRLPPPGRTLRALGVDDAPFSPRRGARVRLVGVVCAGTRFEGLVLGEARRDGWNANAALCRMLEGGKFLPQLHLVLLDGIAFGGLNVVDLHALAARLGLPCVAVMRRRPDLPAMERAVRNLPRAERRLSLLRGAGPVHERGPFTYQVQGGDPTEVAGALARLTDRGNVPEALRLAHLVGGAIARGESGHRA